MSQRINWIDDNDAPAIQEQVGKLKHFTASMADGIIDDNELAKQGENLVAAMKAVQDDLSDEQHAKVTNLLAELAAYSVMGTLNGLAKARQGAA